MRTIMSIKVKLMEKLAVSFVNRYSSTDATEMDLICVVTTLSTIIIAGGAAVFSRYEGWTYFNSVYYCFITCESPFFFFHVFGYMWGINVISPVRPLFTLCLL